MTRRGLAEIADDTALVAGSWTIVVNGDEHRQAPIDGLLDELRDELLFALEGEQADGQQADGESAEVDSLEVDGDIAALIQRVASGRTGDVVLASIRQLDPASWQRLDAARTRFEAGPRVVLVMDASSRDALARNAPHLWSWIVPRVFEIDPDVGRLDVEARLASLREGTGLSDEEVIRRARHGDLPPDPIFAEWLALLGRGELIGP